MNIGLKKRLYAWFIDMVITTSLGVLAGFGIVIASGMHIVPKFFDTQPMAVIGVYFFLPLIIDWLYFALFHSSKAQATIGKRVLKIVVTTDSGERLDFGKATIRYIMKVICLLALGIGFTPIHFTKRKQGVHDLFAGTVVVDKKCCSHENVMDFSSYMNRLDKKKAAK